MTEEERKALKVGDEIIAANPHPNSPDWEVGDILRIDKISSGGPHFTATNGEEWCVSDSLNNIKVFEVVKDKPWTECPGKYRWCKECDVREGDGTGTCGYLHQGCACQGCDAHPSTCKGIPSEGIEMLSAPAPQALKKGDKAIVVGNTTGYAFNIGDVVTCTGKKTYADHPYSYFKKQDGSEYGMSVNEGNVMLVGDLVYKKNMVGKLIAIHDSGRLDIRWKPEDPAAVGGGVRHNILMDGKLQWHHAPEGVGWGEKISSKDTVVGVAAQDLDEGDPVAIDADGRVARAGNRPECFGKRRAECDKHILCTSCLHAKGKGSCVCECMPDRNWSCSCVEECGKSESKPTGCSFEAVMKLNAEDKCGKFIPSDLRRECDNYKPITNTEEHIMATETFRRLERAKEIEMIELPRAEHEVKAAEEKTVLLTEEMDRLKTHPTELAEKEFLLINLVGKDKARKTLRAIELGLPIDINIENVSSEKSMEEESDPIQDLAK